MACFFLSSSSIIIRISGTWRLNITFRCFCWHITFRVSPFCRSFFLQLFFYSHSGTGGNTLLYIYFRVSPLLPKNLGPFFFFANYNKRWLSNFVKKKKLNAYKVLSNKLNGSPQLYKKKRLRHTIKRKRNPSCFFFVLILLFFRTKKVSQRDDAGDHEYNHISHGGLNNSELHLGF